MKNMSYSLSLIVLAGMLCSLVPAPDTVATPSAIFLVLPPNSEDGGAGEDDDEIPAVNCWQMTNPSVANCLAGANCPALLPNCRYQVPTGKCNCQQ
jgi:hypothetical protein